MSCGEPVFLCDTVGFSYLDRFPALIDVSFRLCPGERLALLGANGCGKSTLLKILDGLAFPSTGTFTAFGHPMTEELLEDEAFSAGFRARVGFVFQNSDAQLFSSTVRDEIAFGALQLGLSREETLTRSRDVLAMLGIEDLSDRAPFQLSGGQKRKVAIASVLVMNPDVVLFDEPTAALDPRTQHWLTELLVQLGEAGKTIVVASHDLEAIEEIATRALVFGEDHRLVADGPPRELLADRDLLLAVNLIHSQTRLPSGSGTRKASPSQPMAPA